MPHEIVCPRCWRVQRRLCSCTSPASYGFSGTHEDTHVEPNLIECDEESCRPPTNPKAPPA